MISRIGIDLAVPLAPITGKRRAVDVLFCFDVTFSCGAFGFPIWPGALPVTGREPASCSPVPTPGSHAERDQPRPWNSSDIRPSGALQLWRAGRASGRARLVPGGLQSLPD